jgi:hypothetical protein
LNLQEEINIQQKKKEVPNFRNNSLGMWKQKLLIDQIR